MADEALEAKQVVAEEQEAPAKKRKLSKGMIIFLGILAVEAVALYFMFGVLRGGAKEASAHGVEEAEPEDDAYDFGGYLEKARQLAIGEVSIWDETDPSPRASRRYCADFSVWIDHEAMHEVEAAEEKNPDAPNRVKAAIKELIHRWMLQTGGETLRGLEMQHRSGAKIKDYLNDNLAPLKNKIVEVQVDNFRCSRN